jgi:homospermidine synthase
VFFINTSVEEWIDIEELMDDPPKDRTLYYRQYQVMEKVKGWRPHSRTCVVDHGANPGLISHFVKKGLVDLANKHISDSEVEDSLKQELQSALDNKEWNKLPYLMGVKTIHCSERDTQISNNPKRPGEFVGTWSVEGLIEEGRCPAEMGWGSDEPELPEGAVEFTYGNKNQISLSQMGINTYTRSIVPKENGKDFYQIKGMLIRHGEAFGISDYMTVWGENGELVYRPTVYYCYNPCDFTVASLFENAGDDYTHDFEQRIMMDDEIIDGSDILGALLCGHRYKTWWCGSLLNIHEAKKLCPGNNATSLQVASSLVSAIKWMLTNPNEGYNLPCCLPWEQIMGNAEPYLGTIISQAYDWTPLDYQSIDYPSRLPPLDEKNVWCFSNFLVRE